MKRKLAVPELGVTLHRWCEFISPVHRASEVWSLLSRFVMEL